jgi:very-short-patch-repair endonuclease
MSIQSEPSAARRSAVDSAREGWIRQLIDLSRRNNLLYFRDLKTGTVDLSEEASKAMLPFLQGDSVALADFVSRGEVLAVSAKIREMRRRAISNLEERGLETLFLAMGMASWQPDDEGRATEAAVFLIPVEVEARGREGRSLNLRRNGDVQVNLVLTHVLEVEHGASVKAEDLLDLLQGDDEGESFDPNPVYEELCKAAGHVAGFTVKPRLVLGNFAYQKTAMVRDLREFGDEMAQHDLISAISGDSEARASMQARRTSADPGDIDRAPPESEFLVLDADSSQQLVIRQALGAQDGVIHGPPGTGKSQTIANMIAEFAAQGRRVLFVAEKRAALEVVLERLKQAGLGHLALDLHGAEVSRREIMARFAESLSILRSTPPIDAESTHTRFSQRRRRLVEHVARLHAPQAPSGMSVYQMQGRLLCLERSVKAATRWRGDQLHRLDQAEAETIRDLLEEASGFEGLFVRKHPSPWTGADLPNGQTAEEAMDDASALVQMWPGLMTSLERLREESGLVPAKTLEEARAQIELLMEVSGTLALYNDELYSSGDLPELAAALGPARGGALKVVWAFVSNSAYRAALRTTRLLRRAGKARPKDLLHEVTAALRQVERWKTHSARDDLPHRTPSLDGALEAMRAFVDCLAKLLPKLVCADPAKRELGALGDWIKALGSDTATPHRLPRLIAIERELAEHGVSDLLGELRQTMPSPQHYADTFEHAWLASCLDLVRSENPDLAGFNGRTHDRLVAEFRRLDKERIRIAGDRVRRTHAERAVSVMNANPEQEALVKREAAKKSRHLPIRRLVAQASQVLTALRPCWMASPLSVSHLLPADRQLFDIVLFDEASQVLPEDAVPSLLRAGHAVVAGDRRQLPPTTFFVTGDDEDGEIEDETPTQGFESILDLMSGLLDPWPLDWHYRSRDEALIAFSNRHIYDERLVTFPGPFTDRAIEHVLAPHSDGLDGQEESASAEVRRAVELVLDSATRRPDETLGVIALGIKHARRVETAIEEALRDRPELDAFFDQSRRERFFVKNLERVQGDERDAIILTVGYGKDRAGRLPYRFGPLLTQGGERRLNVAITRARNRMTVVSSFTHHDMDPSRSRARGVELLRLYLEYAASGGTRLGQEGTRAFELNAFERDVFDALTEKGISLLPQWGASRYRIDLVAQHPRERGRLVLAIECDGATYHSAHSARDRDRLRQQHLEALGWRFHRIWSTDWFNRRDEEIARAMAALEAAVHSSDRRGAGHSANERPMTAVSPTTELKRGRQPALGQRPSITDYSLWELEQLVKWIQSDGQLRTDDEILEETIDRLGFDRRGSRIMAAIREAIEAWRQAMK